ncbi:transporter substrate-binding domain-containing protein [Chitinivorax sp. PXF-14]|uniref:substrate-binding periplasmic protein n=1 Tax=Chitinivorax sp. PXF-14 TaxID=3230488 RepID=UPI003466E410
MQTLNLRPRRSHGLQAGLAALLLAAGSSAWADLPDNLVVRVCDDTLEWPPFTYRKRDAAGRPGEEVVGYSIDVLRTILVREQIDFDVKLVPWSRCLAEARRGGTFNMLQNASASQERSRDFWMSRPYYRLNSYYFYSRKRFPAGLDIKGLADFKRYHVCGIHGFNYEPYGLQGDAIDQSSVSFRTLLKRIHLGSCDLFIEKIEVMQGYRSVGEPFIDDSALAHSAVPGIGPVPFHFLVSRAYANGEALVNVLNAGIDEMERSGKLQRLWRSHVGGK